MLTTITKRLRSDEGFTLVELLVVILIIGILAAIAIPSFLNQKGKGEDASAKSAAREAATAMETYYTDKGDYNGANEASLRTIEPTLPPTGTTAGTMTLSNVSSTSYTISVWSKPSGRKFSVTKSGGAVTRDCTVVDPNAPGGCNLTSGNNGSW